MPISLWEEQQVAGLVTDRLQGALVSRTTAKRLCNKAQGCRASRLPWEKNAGNFRLPTPKGLHQGRGGANVSWGDSSLITPE